LSDTARDLLELRKEVQAMQAVLAEHGQRLDYQGAELAEYGPAIDRLIGDKTSTALAVVALTDAIVELKSMVAAVASYWDIPLDGSDRGGGG
jgi:hypothetical protein